MARYPAIEPFDHGMLEVGDGNQLYWECCGNPVGIPVVVLHGGPGSGCGPGWRRYFDPSRYRVILFDQRGCGRSTPSVADISVDLSTNTTDNLIADIERLRELHSVDGWMVFGASWGSTLGMAYAEAHPERVTSVILFSVVTTSPSEVEWVTREMGRIFPEAWERFRDGLPPSLRDGNLAAGYATMLADPDPAVREQAAANWCAWEDTHVSLMPGWEPDPRYDDPEFRMVFARLVTHYWSNHAWREEGELIRNATRLAGIPGVLMAGQRDISGPPDIARRIAQQWPDTEYVLVKEGGHGTGMEDLLIAATDRFADRLGSR